MRGLPTGNAWTPADTRAYDDNRIADIPADRVVSVLEAVSKRTPARVNSFNYFVKSIVVQEEPRNRAWHKKQLARIVRNARDKSVGLAGGSIADFVEDVKCACARERIAFDNDLFNELVRYEENPSEVASTSNSCHAGLPKGHR